MTKKKKTILIISISLAAVLVVASVTVLLIVLLKRRSPAPPPYQTKNELSLTTEKCELIVGDEYTLDIHYKYDGSETITYTSSDESVVTVNEDGVVLATGVGQASVTVSDGSASDACEFTVTTGNLLAMLEYSGLPQDDVRITTADTLDLTARVWFNGKSYDDMKISYVLSDESMGKIEENAFVPAKTGSVEIYATADWRGVTGETLTKTIYVEIVKDVQVFVNNGKQSSFLLYTLDDTKVSVTAGATENGEEIDGVSMELIDGEEYVDFTGSKISSKGLAGEATLRVSCEDSDGEEWTQDVPVKVTQTIVPYTGPQVTNFSAFDGEVVGGDVLLRQAVDGRIVRADDEHGNPLTVENGKVLGVKMGNSGESEATITVYTMRAGYTMTVKGYSGIIDEAKDFAYFGLHNQNYKQNPAYDPEGDDTVGYTFEARNQDGYYILANNIDASGYTQANGGTNITQSLQFVAGLLKENGGCGLTGTIDGQGYTVRSMTVGQFGIFGVIFGGTVKNIAFTDVQYTSSGTSGLMAAYAIDATFQNVYVQAEELSTGGGSLISANMSGTFMSGCLFELPSSEGTGSLTSNAGKYLRPKDERLSLNGFSGVYVISPLQLAKTSKYTIDTLNKPGYTYLFSGITRYDTRAEMQTAYTGGSEYENFDAKYWDKTGSIPAFKTIDFVVEEPPAKDGNQGDFVPDWVDGPQIDWEEILGGFDPDWIGGQE